MEWFEAQDQQINDAYEEIDLVWSNPSNLRRVWGRLDELIIQRHLYNIHIISRSNQKLRILDIGCGEGKLLYYLRFHYPDIALYGIEPNLNLFNRSKKLLSSEITLENIQFADLKKKYHKYFDIVICSEIIEHVEDYKVLIQTIQSVLKNDGYLSISTPSGWMYRKPTLVNFRMLLRNFKKFKNIYLYPESNWQEAIQIHPAIFPKTLINILKNYGFKLISRQSSLWLINDTHFMYRTLKFFERTDYFLPSFLLENFIRLLESTMNLCPFFRIFESRFILLMQKR